MSFESLKRIVSHSRLTLRHPLLDDDKLVWSVAELIEELKGMPQETYVVVDEGYEEGGGPLNLFFYVDLLEEEEDGSDGEEKQRFVVIKLMDLIEPGAKGEQT